VDQFCVPTQLATPLGKKIFINKKEVLPFIYSAIYQDTTSNFVKGRRPSSVRLIFNRSIFKKQGKATERNQQRAFFHNRKLQVLVPAANDIIINFVCPLSA
jgi:hypothetical protein